MLTRNLLLKLELVNGIRGEIVDIIWGPEQMAPALSTSRCDWKGTPIQPDSWTPRVWQPPGVAMAAIVCSVLGDHRAQEPGAYHLEGTQRSGMSEATLGLLLVCFRQAKRLRGFIG